MNWITGLIAKLTGQWLLPAALIAFAALVSLLGVQTWRLHSTQADAAKARAETSDVRSQWAQQAAAGASAAAAASDRYRAIEAQMNQTRQEAEDARHHDQENSARFAAGLAAERDRMRHQLAAYAAGTSGGGSAASDTVAAARVRAETLGLLLEQSVQLQDELAGDAEAANADIRALLAAWPRPRGVEVAP
jgi:hypothetical protein